MGRIFSSVVNWFLCGDNTINTNRYIMSKLFGLCGLEGAFKSNSIATINHVLNQAGKTVFTTHMPGGTPFAEAIRDIHKRDWENEEITKKSELLLMFASHEQLYHNVIIPHLKTTDVVLTDRLWACTYAYQVHNSGDPKLIELYRYLMRTVVNDTPHDEILWLDVDPAVGIERAKGRGELDRIEKKELAYFYNARSAYLKLTETRANITRIDANRNFDAVQEDVRKWATSLLPAIS
jgi:dTMP kinase